jgi:anti-sigma regulatory factor (Ser/Thr protein kinase)
MQSVTHSFSVTYPARAESVAEARSAVGDFAREAGAGDDQVDDVRLAVSEAVTNAVLHAYRGAPGTVQVTAALAGQELWVLVADEGEGMQPQADRPGLGLGLGLISQVCDDIAIVTRSGGGIEARLLFKLGTAAERAAGHGAPMAPAAVDRGFGIPGTFAPVPQAPARD